MAALFDKGRLLTGTQPVDSALSSTSEFPVQNKVVKQNFDSITTTLNSKVNTSDIKNNLTSTDTDKPLSAYQGKVLDDKITTVSNNLTNILPQLFFGNGGGKSYSTSLTSIDSCVNNTVTPTGEADGFFTIDNRASVSGMGNRQFLFGWVNPQKTYGWCFCMGFWGCKFGKRNNSSTFTFTDIA